MDRRSFLILAGSGAAAAATGGAYWKWSEIAPSVHAPGRAEGHFLRDRGALPPPSAVIDVDIAIFGSGIAGLAAAWKLNRAGHRDFLVIDGPERFGNAAGGRFGEFGFPTGGHYLPLPSPESVHVREILHDLGILRGDPRAARPEYDEDFVLHAPEERLLIRGKWQEGIVPKEGLAPQEVAEHERFFTEMERLKTQAGKDGRRAFSLPLAQSSMDARFAELDSLTLTQWLDAKGYRSPSLRWYLDYCCRDDYGVRADKVSAWAGLHYFCSRGGEARNAERGTWLTWPDGLHSLASAMEAKAGSRRRSGTAASIRVLRNGVEATCFELTPQGPRSFVVRARRAICAMPLYVAARVVANMQDYGFRREHLPRYAPWMVSNFLMRRFPEELPEAPLSWDNVVYEGKGLGYVVSTHQDIRMAPPPKSVFTAYMPMAHLAPEHARRWLETAPPDELLDLASADLRSAYGAPFAHCVERADLTLRPHAMAIPAPGFRSNPGLQALRQADGPLLFAHADLSGMSLFEEAAWWGCEAAARALR